MRKKFLKEGEKMMFPDRSEPGYLRVLAKKLSTEAEELLVEAYNLQSKAGKFQKEAFNYRVKADDLEWEGR